VHSKLVTNEFYAPASYAEAMASPHRIEWRRATDIEMANLQRNNT
jgi:hypothetical protein